MKKNKILLTGFGTFGDLDINISEKLINQLKTDNYNNQIEFLSLPVTFNCFNIVEKHILKFQPDYIIHLGVAGNLKENLFRLEKVGINYMNARIPDFDNNQPKDLKIIENYPYDAHFTNLEILNLQAFLEKNNYSSEISYTAGSYVCNYLMFSTLAYINKNNLSIKSDFIHIPLLNLKTPEEQEIYNNLLSGLKLILNNINKLEKSEINSLSGTLS